MVFFIESLSLRLEKDYSSKSNNAIFEIDDDLFDNFVSNIENKYNTTLDFSGDNESDGYSLVDNNLSEVEHQNLFKEFTDFLDVNL